MIIDDYLAFVIAARFALRPILLLDFIVSLVEEKHLMYKMAVTIVNASAPRYSEPFVQHTLEKLKAYDPDSPR